MRTALPPRFPRARPRLPVTSRPLFGVLLGLALLALVIVAVGLAIGASRPVEAEFLAPFRWHNQSSA